MKTKIKIGFVILHYNNIDDTIQYIDSIFANLDTDSFIAVIVDNCSPNGSGKDLYNKYSSSDKVKVILSKNNDGYSAGLNLGIEYLNNNYSVEFIVPCNNDILLIDKNFYKHVSEEYKFSNFSVLAPMVITPDGRCDSNPIFDKPYTKANATYDLAYWKKRRTATKIGLDSLYCFYRRHNPFIRRHKSKIYINRKDKIAGGFVKRRENIVPHGCFFIFSPEYFKHFKGLDARTFMYAEEDILYAHITDKKLKIVYNPAVFIYHKGGASISKTHKDSKKKKLFLFANYISAIEQYLLLLDELKQ